GRWGAKLARCLESLPGCELLVLCDIDRSRIATTHFGVSVRISDSFEAVLTDEAIDAVVIATPAPLHAEQTVRALGSGKHVFVEKPMALSSRHAREITAATASSSRIVMVGHILQHDPTMHQLQKLCASGALGSLQYIEAERFNTTLPGPSEGVWWNLGPHDVSTILQLAGEMPLKVSGSPLRLPGCAGEAYAAQLEFSSGLKADIRVADGYLTKVRRLRVVGSEGSVLWAPLNSNRLQLVPLRGARTE